MRISRRVGRRTWVSMSPLAWVVFGWYYMIFLAAAWLLAGMIWLLWQIARWVIIAVREVIIMGLIHTRASKKRDRAEADLIREQVKQVKAANGDTGRLTLPRLVEKVVSARRAQQ